VSVRAAALAKIAALGPRADGSVLAETMLALARKMDSAKTSPTAMSMCAKAMIDVERALVAMAPPKREADGVTGITDQLAERRRAGVTDPPAASSS
jgi:hypothetical protein